MSFYTEGNHDDITRAVEGLDIFTKNFCMNCKETDRQNDIVFRCKECEFAREDGFCMVHSFVHNHKHKYPLRDFGAMGEH